MILIKDRSLCKWAPNKTFLGQINDIVWAVVYLRMVNISTVRARLLWRCLEYLTNCLFVKTSFLGTDSRYLFHLPILCSMSRCKFGRISWNRTTSLLSTWHPSKKICALESRKGRGGENCLDGTWIFSKVSVYGVVYLLLTGRYPSIWSHRPYNSKNFLRLFYSMIILEAWD